MIIILGSGQLQGALKGQELQSNIRLNSKYVPLWNHLYKKKIKHRKEQQKPGIKILCVKAFFWKDIQYLHASSVQDLVELLQQRVVLLVQESARDGELLRQVGSELLCLQSSEVKLEGLMQELHAEAHHRAVVAERLRAELHAEAQCRAELTKSLHAELHR